MTNYQFLQSYVELQHGIMFDKVLDLGFAIICCNDNDPSSFWNNALVNTSLNATQIESIEFKLKEHNRKPAVYFEDHLDLQDLTDTLLSAGYTLEATDSMMFHSGLNVDSSLFSAVKKVATEQDLDVFMQTFDSCYRKDDPLNPYGELGEYVRAARATWRKHHTNNRIEYFVVYDGDRPVAVSALTSHKGTGYISNVGSLVSERGKGFGKLATMYCIQRSKENGNSTHCLATEEGTNPNAFYKAMGFETRFTAKLLSKKI